MLLSREFEGPALSAATVVTIGAFDGLHLGHQALLAHVIGRARELECSAALVSFEPLPRQYFGGRSLLRLQPPAARIDAWRQLGIDLALLLRFNARLAQMEAADFIEQVLVRRLRVQELWVGPEFRFGRGRTGDLGLLQQAGLEHGFTVQHIALEQLGDLRISASAVRDALMRGDFLLARELLGRPYRYCRRVGYGRQLGRKLGFPTANLRWLSPAALMSGIYAVRVCGAGLWHQPAIASLGTRPTVGGVEPLLEVHVFDFDGDLYGQRLEVEFVAKQRDELKFDSLDALIVQMRRDCEQARQLLA
jgi:riboflavin kinase/FMN adenylyltransferase